MLDRAAADEDPALAAALELRGLVMGVISRVAAAAPEDYSIDKEQDLRLVRFLFLSLLSGWRQGRR